MPYSHFTLKTVTKAFNITIIENEDLYSKIVPVPVSEHLMTTLNYNLPLALAINTEKARSELIISNVLLEVKRSLNDQISLFSGVNLEVDPEQELNGFCDYIISKSPEQYYLTAPIVTIVEAKNENIAGGLGQCIAEMKASQLFNETEGLASFQIYGAVTTGNVWKFLKYESQRAYIDKVEYHITAVNKIVGILREMVKENA